MTFDEILPYGFAVLAVIVGIPLLLAVRRVHLRALLRQRAKQLARLHTEVVGLRQRHAFAGQMQNEIRQSVTAGQLLGNHSGVD